MCMYRRFLAYAGVCLLAGSATLVGSPTAESETLRRAATKAVVYSAADLAGDWSLCSFWQDRGFQDQGYVRGTGALSGAFPYTAGSRGGGTVSQTYTLTSTISGDGTVSITGLGDGSHDVFMNAGKDVMVGVDRINNAFTVLPFVRRGSHHTAADLSGTWHVASYWVQGDWEYVGYTRLSGSFGGTFWGNEESSDGGNVAASVRLDATVDAGGKVTISADGQTMETFMNASKDVVITAAHSSAGTDFNMICAVKQGASYERADLNGTWHAATFHVQRDFGHVGCSRMSGSFGGTATYSSDNSTDGESSGTVRLAATIDSTGKVTLTGSDTPRHSGRMNASKNVIAMVNALDGDFNLLLWVKEAAAPPPPAVTTAPVAQVTTADARCGGNVTADGGTPITARGVCWSTAPSPTTADSKTADGSDTGAFSSAIVGLAAGTTYHVRAYATNAADTAYGEERTFTTLTPVPAAAANGHDLWDLTGDYATTVGLRPLRLHLVHDTNGRLSGMADMDVPTGKEGTRVAMPIRGSVREAGGALVVSMALQGTATTGKAGVTLGLKLTLDAAQRRLTGTVRGIVRADAVPTSVTENMTLDIPGPMDGTWTLGFDLARSARAVCGTATLTLANDVHYHYTVAGRPFGQMLLICLTGDPIDPQANAIGLRAWVTPQADGLSVLNTCFCRGYGQTAVW